MTKTRLDKETIALRAARELRDGDCVNLGFGIPSLACNLIPGDRRIVFQSENGLIGYGPITGEEEADWDAVNAAGQPITLAPGISFLDHAQSFAMIRGGHVDVAILGALQVSEKGDLANWMVPGRLGGMGGAMDLVAGAKRVIVTMVHDADGKPKIVRRCSYALTGRACVALIITDLAVIKVGPGGLALQEVAPGWTPEEIQVLTEPRLQIAPPITEFRS